MGGPLEGPRVTDGRALQGEVEELSRQFAHACGRAQTLSRRHPGLGKPVRQTVHSPKSRNGRGGVACACRASNTRRCDVGTVLSVFNSDSDDSDSDDSLIERTLAGDNQAFNVLTRRYAPIVLAWLAANNGDVSENEDLAQEALLSAYLALANLRSRGRFGPWLVSIARSKLADSRRRQVRQIHITRFEDNSYENMASPVGRKEDEADGPRERASFSEIESIVLEAIGRMNDTYREILHLRLFSEETPQVIAYRLGLKESTVRMRLLRGLKKLRKRIKKERGTREWG